uniref:Uncharacterized protein n=1 Tax=Avena sativa TaxID=4498 RepID=A0ACD5XDK1_AVESA
MALPRSEEEDSIPVMIRVKAPRYDYGCRSLIDLVLVLDITGTMAGGENLSQIKQGALFVLRNLQAQDRLSVVALHNNCTHLLFPLTYLSDEDGKKAWARTKIEEWPSFAADVDIIHAPVLETVYQILAQRRYHDDRLARIMVLTDGVEGKAAITTKGDYPTYTFGLGPEHDRWKAYGVASQGHGTYSFDSTTDLKSIGAAMALCIGGLTSIAAEHVEISIRSEQPAGVRISRITSGAYPNQVKENGTFGSIIVDDIYSSEEKNFLVYVNVPRDDAAGGFFRWTTKTKLLTVEANYYCPVSESFVCLDDPVEVSVERKGQTQASSQAVEVAGEVTRARVLEEVAKIAADGRTDSGGFSLAAVRRTIEDTPEAKAAKDTWEGLSRDLDSMEDAETGIPFMLSWLTSHQWQRAAMPGSMSKQSLLMNFRTTRMNNLIDSVDLAPLDIHAHT